MEEKKKSLKVCPNFSLVVYKITVKIILRKLKMLPHSH